LRPRSNLLSKKNLHQFGNDFTLCRKKIAFVVRQKASTEYAPSPSCLRGLIHQIIKLYSEVTRLQRESTRQRTHYPEFFERAVFAERTANTVCSFGAERRPSLATAVASYEISNEKTRERKRQYVRLKGGSWCRATRGPPGVYRFRWFRSSARKISLSTMSCVSPAGVGGYS